MFYLKLEQLRRPIISGSSAFTELTLFQNTLKIRLKFNPTSYVHVYIYIVMYVYVTLTLKGKPRMITTVHSHHDYSLLLRRHCSVLWCRACNIPMLQCYLPGSNAIQRARGKHKQFKSKKKYGFIGQGNGTPASDKQSTHTVTYCE